MNNINLWHDTCFNKAKGNSLEYLGYKKCWKLH